MYGATAFYKLSLVFTNLTIYGAIVVDSDSHGSTSFLEPLSASSSNKIQYPHPDPHQIKIRIRIRTKVMRIRNTEWSCIERKWRKYNSIWRPIKRKSNIMSNDHKVPDEYGVVHNNDCLLSPVLSNWYRLASLYITNLIHLKRVFFPVSRNTLNQTKTILLATVLNLAV
jgi:hypothetical protein